MTCYYRPKLTIWLGKLILSKKTPRIMDNFSNRRTLEAILMTTGRLLGPPWKLWGITVQTICREGRWYQKLWVHKPDPFFGYGQGYQRKTELFRKSLCTREFSTGKSFGASSHWILSTQDSENIYERGYKIFLTLFWSAEVGCVLPNAVR